MSALQNKQKTRKNILPFITEYRPSVASLKTIQMSKWHLIENQPLLREIYKDPSPLSYRKREIFERLTRKSKLALKVIFFLSRPIGAVFGLSSLFYHHLNGMFNIFSGNLSKKKKDALTKKKVSKYLGNNCYP